MLDLALFQFFFLGSVRDVQLGLQLFWDVKKTALEVEVASGSLLSRLTLRAASSLWQIRRKPVRRTS